MNAIREPIARFRETKLREFVSANRAFCFAGWFLFILALVVLL